MSQDFYDNFEEEPKVSLSDKFVGVFTEPSNIFNKIKAAGATTMDWLLPILIFSLVAGLINFLSLNDPEIRMKMQEKQMEKIEKNFNKLVENGTISQEKADEQLDKISERMSEQLQKGRWIQLISIFLVTFILFFILAGFYYLVMKYGFKGSGTYKDAMTAYGLPYYILTLSYIVVGLTMFLLSKPLQSVSVGALLDYDSGTIVGLLLNKLDVFAIWFYTVIGIGFAKMFDIKSTKKVILWIYVIWIGFSLLLYFAGELFPFLKFFGF